jgi:histidinol-phosphate phosphatase family protein
MSETSRVLTQAFQENPILGALAGVWLDGGRVISTGEISENLLNMVPDVLFFERRSLDEMHLLGGLSPKDFLLVEKLTVDQVWALSQKTAAQLVLITEKVLDPSLADYQIQEKDLRSALLGLGAILRKIRESQEVYPMQGQREAGALFLDRDGVMIEDVDYIRDPNLVKIRPDVKEAIVEARNRNMRVIVITNQSGIGRGTISWHDYDQVTLKMQSLLAEQGLFVDRILRAPYFEQSTLPEGLIRRSLRKPRPGMIHEAVAELRLDLSKSILIGDCASDLMAGAMAGIEKVFLLKSHRTPIESKKWRDWPLLSRTKVGVKPIEIATLSEAFTAR